MGGELLAGLAAQAVKQRTGGEGLPAQVKIQLGQAVGRATKPAKLLAQVGRIDSAALGRAKRLRRAHRHAKRWLLKQAPGEHKRLALVGGRTDPQGLPMYGRAGLGIGPRRPLDLGIVAAPNKVAHPNTTKADRAVGKAQL